MGNAPARERTIAFCGLALAMSLRSSPSTMRQAQRSPSGADDAPSRVPETRRSWLFRPPNLTLVKADSTLSLHDFEANDFLERGTALAPAVTAGTNS
jgi:hypothetical protein